MTHDLGESPFFDPGAQSCVICSDSLQRSMLWAAPGTQLTSSPYAYDGAGEAAARDVLGRGGLQVREVRGTP